MPQNIRVVKCYKCSTYQTDIVKKTNKWQCKLCGEKQSLFKEFFSGTGQMCRKFAQKLNAEKIVKDEQQLEVALNHDFVQSTNTFINPPTHQIEQTTPNKWLDYVEPKIDDEDSNSLIRDVHKNRQKKPFRQNDESTETERRPLKKLRITKNTNECSFLQDDVSPSFKNTTHMFDDRKKRSDCDETTGSESQEILSKPVETNKIYENDLPKANVCVNQSSLKWKQFLPENEESRDENYLFS